MKTDEQIADELVAITPLSKPFYLEQRIFGAKWMRTQMQSELLRIAGEAFEAGRMRGLAEAPHSEISLKGKYADKDEYLRTLNL